MARPVPTLDTERALFADGARIVVGIDEVGRGAIAGPVTVGAVALDAGCGPFPEGLADSKLLTPRRREAMAPLVRGWALACATGWASAAEIDRHGIVSALGLAASRALAGLGAVAGVLYALIALGFMLIIQLGSLGLPFAYFGGTSPAAPSGELTLVSDNSAEIDRVAEFTETYIMQDKDETAPLRAQDAFALFKAVTGSDLDSKRAFGSRFVKALDTIGFSYTRVRVGGFGHTAYQGINLTPGGWRLLERKKEEAA